MIHEEIRTLLDAPRRGEDAPSIDDVEHTLTAGYARALALEAERWRLERRIGEVAREGPTDFEELRSLGTRLSRADGELVTLRNLLARLRERARLLRKAS
jgi:hypothetical protein